MMEKQKGIQVAQISVVIPALNEEKNISILIEKVRDELNKIMQDYEIIVVDGLSVDGTVDAARKSGARVIIQQNKGFGCALREGFQQAKGEYVITLDADLSHNPEIINTFWKERHSADILVGSRYIAGGG